MALLQAKCTNCGGELTVDDGKKAAVCQFCGEAFIVEEAVNNYITNHITNNTVNNILSPCKKEIGRLNVRTWFC